MRLPERCLDETAVAFRLRRQAARELGMSARSVGRYLAEGDVGVASKLIQLLRTPPPPQSLWS